MTPPEVSGPATTLRVGRLLSAALASLLFVGLTAVVVTMLAIGALGAAASVAPFAAVALALAIWLFRGSIRRSPRPATGPSAVIAELPARRTRSSAMEAWRQPETMFWVLAIASLLVGVGASAMAGLALLASAPLLSGGVTRLSQARWWRLFTPPAAVAIILGLFSAGLGTAPQDATVPIVLAIAFGSFVCLSSLTVLGYGLGWLAQRLEAGKTVQAQAPVTAKEAIGRELMRATDELRAPAVEREYPVSPEGEDARRRDEGVLSSRGYHLVRVWKQPAGEDQITVARFERS